MITTLHIKNIGIIEDITIDFNRGLNVLTGETGAGKTLIIDSLQIISGGRFSKEMIRNGEDYSFIEANFYCPNHEQSIEGNIIISREIHSNGRSSCKINGRLATVNELKELMSQIIDIHGQHDSQLILNQAKHITYLDNFVGKELEKELKSNYLLRKNKLPQKKKSQKFKQISLLLKRHILDSPDAYISAKKFKWMLLFIYGLVMKKLLYMLLLMTLLGKFLQHTSIAKKH